MYALKEIFIILKRFAISAFIISNEFQYQANATYTFHL